MMKIFLYVCQPAESCRGNMKHSGQRYARVAFIGTQGNINLGEAQTLSKNFAW